MEYFAEKRIDKIFFEGIDKARDRAKELGAKDKKDILDNLQLVKQSCQELVEISDKKTNQVILDLADTINKKRDNILKENKKDLELMDRKDPKYLRLSLDNKKIDSIIDGLKDVAELPSPLDIKLEERTLYNGLELEKRSVPIGVIAVIYESRPNVTPDVFSLCFKAGNACVLKGGSDAANSNKIFFLIIQETLEKNNINKNIITLLTAQRESVNTLFKAHGLVDVIIPRGSQGLINYVRENSQIPVIETGAGVVHMFFDKTAELEMGKKLINNAKTSRPAACNALDTFIIHKDRLADLSQLVIPLVEYRVEIFADDQAYTYLENNYPKELLHKASKEDFGREFLSLKMSIKTVANLDEALEHIKKYSSGHSEAIISQDKANIEEFFQHVDAAVVYSNAPTVFTDGGEFGLGCEIGISTQKLHARGPMGLRELTSYKWVVRGNGQIRK
ncbi:glutamate-5-semialdehyde dehydrogenase [Patescibacteria group bacterium]|nr:glutamate-5-semialdehyde dehydrogenase [Patescibacteria group bacterium]